MPQASSPMPVQYRIDGADRIQFLNEAWLQFACQNDGAHLNRANVIGKPIWEFIEGEAVCELYGQVFKAVRVKQQAVGFKFRCDSPVCRRYFLLTVAPLQEEVLMLSTHPVREESRKPVTVLDPDVERGESFLKICSWCLKACLSAKQWVELEKAITRFDLLGGRPVPHLTHGICPDCQTMVEDELKNLRTG